MKILLQLYPSISLSSQGDFILKNRLQFESG